MRFVPIIFALFICSNIFAQDRPVLQWQKSFGGSLHEITRDFKVLPDGNYIMLGSSHSNNGDIPGHHGSPALSDVCIIKSDPAGNVIWKKNYGGSAGDDGFAIIQTTDGGFMLVGTSLSNDGDVTGHHGTTLYADLWVVKLDASGNILWQKSYGGSFGDFGHDILETSGGYIITGSTESTDGDIADHHGIFHTFDLLVLKIDYSGTLIWQKCYGGNRIDEGGGITPTPDGSFLLNGTTNSIDGDVSNPVSGPYDAWILKISATGTLIWNKCIGGNDGDQVGKVLINSDGTLFLHGGTASTDLPGAFPRLVIGGFACGDGWVVMLDANGNTLWQKAFGGTLNDAISDAIKTPDGGYLLVGSTDSRDGMICPKYLLDDTWMVKMDGQGNIQWSRTFGGNNWEAAVKSELTSSGELVVLSISTSSDGDLTNNNGSADFWLARFSFTGPLISPSVIIKAATDSIRCVGAAIQFTAFPVNGGPNPRYQWKINGVNTGINENPITLNNVGENDVVSCVLNSNANCIDLHEATSNSVKIKVKLPPAKGFLPKDTALCSYQRMALGPNTTRFNSYLWSDGSTTMNITVKGPGLYWLQVRDYLQCLSRDSVTILPKTCIEGVFVPNAFTPNRDGYNDLFMPIMNADVKAYKFVVYDRWGRIVFQTTTLNKGWDGKVNGLPYDTGVFAWVCQYQLDGEAPAAKRGTVLLLR